MVHATATHHLKRINMSLDAWGTSRTLRATSGPLGTLREQQMNEFSFISRTGSLPTWPNHSNPLPEL